MTKKISPDEIILLRSSKDLIVKLIKKMLGFESFYLISSLPLGVVSYLLRSSSSSSLFFSRQPENKSKSIMTLNTINLSRRLILDFTNWTASPRFSTYTKEEDFFINWWLPSRTTCVIIDVKVLVFASQAEHSPLRNLFLGNTKLG